MRSGGAVRTYLAYAAGHLTLTLLSGVWLRASFLRPEVLGGLHFGDVLHAHSHVAFFGWTTPAIFALIAACLPAATRRDPWLGAHAHLVGVGSGAAFVGFMLSGYAPHTIALSTVHVVLWVTFALAAWAGLGGAGVVPRTFYRAALAFLVVAGAGAILPGVVLATGITDPWINQITLQAFLTPFISGWLLLGVMGGAYAVMSGGRYARPVLLLTVIGALPSAFLHTSAAPPWEALLWAGRGGTVMLGVAALLLGADLLRVTRRFSLLRLAGVAALTKGVADLTVALGLATALLDVRNLSIAYLHLVLLAVVTPLLLLHALRVVPTGGRVVAFSGGVGVMLGALLLLGWPGGANMLTGLGLPPTSLLWLALAGAAVAAVAAITLLPTGRLFPDEGTGTHPEPAAPHRAAGSRARIHAGITGRVGDVHSGAPDEGKAGTVRGR